MLEQQPSDFGNGQNDRPVGQSEVSLRVGAIMRFVVET
jgi:hypothetical protein